MLNSSLPEQNGRHFTDDIFICMFVNEKFYISIKIPLMFLPKEGGGGGGGVLIEMYVNITWNDAITPNKWQAIA